MIANTTIETGDYVHPRAKSTAIKPHGDEPVRGVLRINGTDLKTF